ncbi:MAG TPA: DUF5686 family protein [Bacteroidales bacterium]|nr:DUF5686 family protein [Bacteroidales bacterium]
MLSIKRGFLVAFLCFVGAFLGYSVVIAQKKSHTIIKGKVFDAKTNEPIAFANILLVGEQKGVTSNIDGEFVLESPGKVSQILISYIGYKKEYRDIKVGETQYLSIKLFEESKNLEEVKIWFRKRKYKNKDNPAVELIQNVINKKSENRFSDLNYMRCQKYEKAEFGVSNIDEKFKKRWLLKKFQFVFDNVDTTKISGQEVLPVYLKERVADYYFRKDPKNEISIHRGTKSVTFDGIVDDEGISEYVDYLNTDIDIYANDIPLVTKQFIGPLAGSSPIFYKFYLSDTLDVDGQSCIKVFFSPRNKTDLLLQGYLYITNDTSYAVKKVDMYVNQGINLNWVRNIRIKQEYAKLPGSNKYLLATSSNTMEFGITKRKGIGLFGHYSISYKDYKINEPFSDSIFSVNPQSVMPDSVQLTEAEMEALRHSPLSDSERGIYTTMDSVKKVPMFKNIVNAVNIVTSGYGDLGYFEVGPLSTFYSYNPVEGSRVRFGGRTTDKLSKKINLDTYAAYGFKDERFKYFSSLTYSLSPRSCFEFPVKAIKVSYQHETKIPGQELQFVQEDNFLLSIKRGINDKLLYNKSFKISNVNEFRNHFSYTLGYEHTIQSAGGNLFFNTNDYLAHTNTNDLNISEFSLTLRYAPHEAFYQGKKYRRPIINKYPIFELQYITGNKAFGNDFNYHKLNLSIFKRFYVSVLGYSNVNFEASKIFGQVPFPLLYIHRANQTYAYQLESYNLMNFLEFVSDQYVSLFIDHDFNGFFFNKIPLIKKLKFREVASFKILYGGVTNENMDYNAGLYKFPVSPDGVPLTYTLEDKPYVEASIGVANILKLFRIDLVKRFSYLNNPNTAELGIRVRFKVYF